MTPVVNIASIADDVGVDLLVYSRNQKGLVPLSVRSLVNTDEKLEIWKAPGTTDEDVSKVCRCCC